MLSWRDKGCELREFHPSLRLYAFDCILSSAYQVPLQEVVWEETGLEWAMQTHALVGVTVVE